MKLDLLPMPTMIAVAGNILATQRWVWLPGMKALNLHHPYWAHIVDSGMVAICRVDEDVPTITKFTRFDASWIPDLNHKLTVMGFMSILQDLYKDPMMYPRLVPSLGGIEGYECGRGYGHTPLQAMFDALICY